MSEVKPPFTPEQKDYMVNRSINLLLSDFEKPEATPEIGYTLASDPDKIKTVFSMMFLRQFLFLTRELLNSVIPLILRRLVSLSQRVEHEYEGFIKGNVNWHKTILAQLEKEGVFVVRKPTREFLTPENTLLALTLREVNIHTGDLISFFKPNLIVEREKLRKIKLVSQKYYQNIYLQSCVERATKFLNLERNFLRNKLAKNMSSHTERYQMFCDYAEKAIVRRRIVNKSYLDLLVWRRAYADLVNGFASLSKKEFLQRKWEDDRLYEIWAFCEILASAKRWKVNVKPFSALYQSRGRPLYYLGTLETNPVYYNTSLEIESSKEIIPELELQLQRLFVRGSRPDMIVANTVSPYSSIIIDMKNYLDTKGDAYVKVLGYMKNYNVQNGAVVYPVDIKHKDLVNPVEELPNFVRTEVLNGNFIALTLKPGRDFENMNSIGLKKFTEFLADKVLN